MTLSCVPQMKCGDLRLVRIGTQTVDYTTLTNSKRKDPFQSCDSDMGLLVHFIDVF